MSTGKFSFFHFFLFARFFREEAAKKGRFRLLGAAMALGKKHGGYELHCREGSPFRVLTNYL
jgi:hypothetical protein